MFFFLFCLFLCSWNMFLVAEKTKLTVATVEGGNIIAGQPELSKGTEYFENALEVTSE